MTNTKTHWVSSTDAASAFGKNPISFLRELKRKRDDGYLKKGIHFIRLGESPNSAIRWNISELENYFSNLEAPRRNEK